MNFRHAAALALVGWYLMVPPVRNGEIRNVPLPDWGHFDSFDTAKECRDAGYDLIERTEKQGDKDRIMSAKAFECIASDDPRLKGK